jgi:hypothetical protein
MLTSNNVGRAVLRAATGLALIVLAACGAEDSAPEQPAAHTTLPVSSSTAAAGNAGACAHVDVPMMDIPTVTDTEPQMRIPQPPGWARNTELDNVDKSLRFTLANAGGSERPQNVAVVALEPAPDADAQKLFDTLRADLVKQLEAKNLPTNVKTTARTVCGLPAQMLVHPGASPGTAAGAPPARPSTVLQVVSKTGGQTYLISVTVTVQSDTTHQRDAETILTGFEVLPPAAAKP